MTLIRLRATWHIKAPRQKVYDIMSDFEHVPDHFPAVAKSSRILSQEGNHLSIDAETRAFFGSKAYKVHMETDLRPPEGFVSVNTSSLGVERESFIMRETPDGTRIDYANDVEVKGWFLRLFGGLVLGKVALKFWERNVIGKLRDMLETRPH